MGPVEVADLRRTAKDGDVKIPEAAHLCQGHKEALTHRDTFPVVLHLFFVSFKNPPSDFLEFHFIDNFISCQGCLEGFQLLNLRAQGNFLMHNRN